MYEIDELIATNKAKNGASAHVWYLDFKALSVPLSKKLEALEEYAQQIAEKYDPEDSAGAFEIFDLYRRIINKLDADKEIIFKQLETDIKYAERFSLDADKLDQIRAEMENLRAAFDSKVHHVKLITEVPAYVNAKAALNEKKRAELLQSAGIDAQQVYDSALQMYDPNAVNNNQALSLFEQVRGYGDSVDHINNINKYFNYHAQLFHFSGKTFLFRHPKPQQSTLNVSKPGQGSAADAPDPEEQAQAQSLALYEIVDGEPAKTPIVMGIDQVLTGYGSRLYYFKRVTSRVYTEETKKGCGSKKTTSTDTPRFTNCDGLYCYNFATNTEECLDKSPLAHYRVTKGDYDVRLNRAGNVMFFKKKLPIRKMQEKVGCLTALFKGQPEPEVVQRNNNFSVIAIDLKNNATSTFVDAMVDIADYYDDSLFYIQAEETAKKRVKEGEEKPKVKTHLMVCNVNTGENSRVLNEGCKIHNVVDGKIIYSVWTPNDYNNDLRVYDMKAGTDTLIEQNALDYRCTLKNYVYYTVGNDDFCPLMRNTLDGTERMEILQHVDNIVETRGDWLYIKRGSGRNAALFKLSADGKERIFLCAQFKCFVKITEDYLYYLDAWDNLHIVRPDGKENRTVATDLDIVNGNIKASIIIANDCIYYVRRENVEDDRISKSLYKMDLNGHNIRKLVFDIDKMLDYDENKLYYSRYENMRYKVTIPASKKKDETSHYETRRLHKFFTMSKETDESTLILTLNRPHGTTTFKKGCLGKNVTENIIYKEDPIIRAYKRRNVAKVGSNTAAATQNVAANLQNTAIGKLLLGKKSNNDTVVTKAPKQRTRGSITPISLLLFIGAVLCAVFAAVLPRVPVGVVLRFLIAVGCVAMGALCFGVLDGVLPFMRNKKISGRKLLAVFYVLAAILSIVMAITILASAPWKGSSFKNALPLYEDSTEYVDNDDYDCYYEINPSKTGYYSITGSTSSSYASFSATLYDEDHNTIEYSSPVKSSSSYYPQWIIETELTAGETYILYVSGGSDYSRSIYYEFSGTSAGNGKTMKSAINADLDYTYNATGEAYYKFTPSTTDIYYFESFGSADPDLYIYSSPDSSSYIYSNTGGGNFATTFSLSSGTTYYIKVACDSSSSSFSFKMSKLPTLSTGSSYTVSGATSSSPKYYKFTPTSTGFYTFSSSGSASDPDIRIYSSSSSSALASDTNSGHFDLSYNLSSSTTYYIEVFAGSSSDTFSFTVSR